MGMMDERMMGAWGDGWDGGWHTGSDGGWMVVVLEGIRRVGLVEWG